MNTDNSFLQLNQGNAVARSLQCADGVPHRNYREMQIIDGRSEEGATSLIAFERILLRHKGKILFGMIVGLVLSLMVGLAQHRVYRARTSLEIQDLGENFLNLKDQDPTVSPSGGATESYLQTQIKILQSQGLIEQVVTKLSLYHGPISSGQKSFSNSLRAFVHGPYPPDADRQRFINDISNRLTVRAPSQTHIVEVFFDSDDPKLSANFANALVQEFVTYSRQMRWESSRKTVDWLTIQLDEMKTKLEASESQLQDYAHAAGLVFTGDSEHLAELKLRQLQDELAQAQADRADKQSRSELTQSHATEALPSVLEDGTLKEYRVKLADLQREFANLSSTLTPEHYRVRAIEAQIAQLETDIKMEQQNILTRSANDYEGARRREALLSEAYAKQLDVVSSQAQKAIHYSTLKHEVDTNNQIYGALLQRIQQAGLASAMRSGNILIVDTAAPPTEPYSPNLPLNSAIGLFCGTFFAVGAVLLSERLNTSFHDPGVAPMYLKIPELGVIPRLKDGMPGRLTASGTSSALTLRGAMRVGGVDRALFVESFRNVLTSILLPSPDGKIPKIIVVASPEPGAGKTTVTAQLGIAAAEAGRRLVLIDGDLRRPQLHEALSVSSSWGLSDLLQSELDLDAAPFSDLALETAIPRLFVLPSGSMLEKPNQLLHSQRMSDLLRRITREVDLVLIDAPPIIPIADARILGHLSDGVILVLHANHTTRHAASAACERLEEDGTRVLGTVLNSWKLRQDQASGYGDLYKSYGRSSSSSGVNSNHGRKGDD